jgi:hypothetical protein
MGAPSDARRSAASRSWHEILAVFQIPRGVLVDGPARARQAAAVPRPLLDRRAPLVLALAAALAAGAAGGCESEKQGSSVLARELDKICNAVERSGATGEPEPANRMAMVALWLGQNVKSEEGLAFLAAFSRLGEDKAARYTLLQDTARAHGIRDCPLLAYWK